MFEISIPQDYGIKESIALVTNKDAKKSESYRKIKLAFAQKLICFQDVTLDDYKSVTIMQEDNRYDFPFLIISDGLTREIFSAEEALQWIYKQEESTPKYNGYMLYYIHLPDKHINSMEVDIWGPDKTLDLVDINFNELDVSSKGKNSFEQIDFNELSF